MFIEFSKWDWDSISGLQRDLEVSKSALASSMARPELEVIEVGDGAVGMSKSLRRGERQMGQFWQ